MCNSNFEELDITALGARIRAEREDHGWTREEFAEIVDITPRYVAQFEVGERGVSLRLLYRISQVLDVSLDYLTMGDLKKAGKAKEKEMLKKSILEPLKNCNTEQLRCMERISRYFAKSIEATKKKK